MTFPLADAPPEDLDHQMVLGREVRVRRCGRDLRAAGHAAHGQRLEADGAQLSARGVGDPVHGRCLPGVERPTGRRGRRHWSSYCVERSQCCCAADPGSRRSRSRRDRAARRPRRSRRRRPIGRGGRRPGLVSSATTRGAPPRPLVPDLVQPGDARDHVLVARRRDPPVGAARYPRERLVRPARADEHGDVGPNRFRERPARSEVDELAVILGLLVDARARASPRGTRAASCGAVRPALRDRPSRRCSSRTRSRGSPGRRTGGRAMRSSSPA